MTQTGDDLFYKKIRACLPFAFVMKNNKNRKENQIFS